MGKPVAKAGLLAVMLAAFAGLGYSAFVHASTYVDFDPLPLGDVTATIYPWAMLAVFVTLLLLLNLAKEERRAVGLADFIATAPPLMRWILRIAFLVALVSFVSLALSTQELRGETPFVGRVRFLSSVWMLAFAFPLSAAWSNLRLIMTPPPRCPNGHRVAKEHGYCPSCGAKVAHNA